MADQKISVDEDAAAETTHTLMTHIEALPIKGTLICTHGTSEGVTNSYHSKLTAAASQLDFISGELRNVLESSHSKIAQTVADLVGRDASLAGEATALLAALDALGSAPATPAVPTTNTSASGGFA